MGFRVGLWFIIHRRYSSHGATKNSRPSVYLYIAALKEASKSKDVIKGRKIHADAAENGYVSNIYLANTLVDMYAKCGNLKDAQSVFDGIQNRNVVSWAVLISGYAQNGEGSLALQLFEQMERAGFGPHRAAYLAALKACTNLAAKEELKKVNGRLLKQKTLERVMYIHSQAAKNGFDSDGTIANSLIDAYGKCGSMANACKIFDKMPQRMAVTWTGIILGYAQNGESNKALQLFDRMLSEGCTPDRPVFLAALKACTGMASKELSTEVNGKPVKVEALANGMRVHSEAAKRGYDSDTYVANSLVDMYGKCGSMWDARRVFDKMSGAAGISWTAIILGYAQNGEGKEALELYGRMQRERCIPDAPAFVAAIQACSGLAEEEEGELVLGNMLKVDALEKGKTIHSQAIACGCDRDIFVSNTLIDMYAKCGSLTVARDVFEKMARHSVVSWTALMLGYAQNGQGEETLHLLTRMQIAGCAPNAQTFVAALQACSSLAVNEESKEINGKPMKNGILQKVGEIHTQCAKYGYDSDLLVANSLIDIYAKCGSLEDASMVFKKMQLHSVVSWTALILGYASNGEGKMGVQLFAQMQLEGCTPNVHTFVAVLRACGYSASLDIGRTIHSDISVCKLDNHPMIVNSLVDFYGRCGNMAESQQIFDRSNQKNAITWSALIAGYGRQGDTKQVFDLFHKMRDEDLLPDGVTFLSILTACSHAGLVDKGMEYFHLMSSKYGLQPSMEHYHCMIDLLGRANRLEEAVAMVKTMPFKPNVVTWITVLSACQKWKNVAVGRFAFESVLEIDDVDAAYSLMANIYGSLGLWKEKIEVRSQKIRKTRS